MASARDPVTVSSGEEEEEDANLPSRDECESRCQAFADVTETDTALAMFYLQDRGWDLDRAVSAFFEERGQAPPEHHRISAPTAADASAPTGADASAPAPKNNLKTSAESAQAVAPAPSPSLSVMNSRARALDPEPHRIRLLSWNIDGLDQNNVANRARGVCDVIKKERPHVVFLQEVVAGNLAVLEQGLPDYQVVEGGDQGYFTAILLRVGDVELEDSTVADFQTSRMGRNLLTVECKIKGEPLLLLTSHLESQKEYGGERLRQLGISLEKVKSAPPSRTVIFGGDLNLRDKEVAKARIPDDIYDLWEVTGKRPEAKFTWDMQLNDNKEFEHFRPRCRFDRLYLRHSQPRRRLKPVYFELVGLERLSSCRRYPSDHWGLLAHFDIQSEGVRGQERGATASTAEATATTAQ